MEPEQKLWMAVIERAIDDARGEFVRGSREASAAMEQAKRWLSGVDEDFHAVCDMAGVTPEYVSRIFKKYAPNLEPRRRRRVQISATFISSGNLKSESSAAY